MVQHRSDYAESHVYSRQAIGQALDTRRDAAVGEAACALVSCSRQPHPGLVHHVGPSRIAAQPLQELGQSGYYGRIGVAKVVTLSYIISIFFT